jgi:phosphoribosylamine--glycine ligase
MNILVIGSGGREHALAWKIAQSPLVTRLICAPGNAGMAEVAECVALDASDHDAVVALCRSEDIGLVVVGPEQPLIEGIVDRLEAEHILAFGPRKDAAQLEGSKGFTKALCDRMDIPTAAYGHFTDAASAKTYLRTKTMPIVIKADGLAAGKGVIIAESLAEAEAAVDDMFGGAFGAAGAEVVIEEFMEGEEASLFALTDGTNILPLVTAQDHKRVGEGDVGPNTGGMGAYSPAPVMTPDLVEATMTRIIEPTVRGLAESGTPYRGVLYAGLMITSEGPKLVEYNARFGDPETQVLMPRLKSDLVPVLLEIAKGALATTVLDWTDDAAVTVVMASNGYPGSYEKGTVIEGVEAAAKDTGAVIFHAGTAMKDDKLVATGGRVLNVTALGASVTAAAQTAYKAVDLIKWPGGFCRRDIGWRALEREAASSLD